VTPSGPLADFIHGIHHVQLVVHGLLPTVFIAYAAFVVWTMHKQNQDELDLILAEEDKMDNDMKYGDIELYSDEASAASKEPKNPSELKRLALLHLRVEVKV
jgi:hypothetical protein